MSTTDDTTPTEPTAETSETPPARRPRRRAASRPAGPPAVAEAGEAGSGNAESTTAPEKSAPPVKRARSRRAKAADEATPTEAAETDAAPVADAPVPAAQAENADAPPAAPTRSRRRATRAAAAPDPAADDVAQTTEGGEQKPAGRPARGRRAVSAPAFSTVDEAEPTTAAESAAPATLMFQAPAPETSTPVRRRRSTRTTASAEPETPVAPDEDVETKPARTRRSTRKPRESAADLGVLEDSLDAVLADAEDEDTPGESPEPDEQLELVEDAEATEGESDADVEGSAARRRRRRGGRGRRRRSGGEGDEAESGEAEDGAEEPPVEAEVAEDEASGSSSRRRRRRRRGGEDGEEGGRTRERARRDEITSVKGSTRLEAKKQRRREGREAGRRRPSILTEAEFLARREAVERVMVVRELADRTQIAVLEDDILVEHYVNRHSGASMIGNVYLGRVQNVLPSMEAAFVDIGRGRNAVLYAGEVNWDAAGLDGQPRRIESALKSGDAVLVQVTKDPIGHKGARLTSQISLPGRFLVYVPHGEMTGISRKLPDTERTRLKGILRDIVPEGAGVIVRTAAEGASEEELVRDVERLAAQWKEIEDASRKASAPALLKSEPDLAIKVVRDIFNEDFAKLVVDGQSVGEQIESYVGSVAPDLLTRVEQWVGTDEIFHAFRVDEQLAKALDRKVWLPSGGSLVIDRTEAMTVVDVNTGKFTGSGGNLEETVTKNNIEAAEEIVRQLRLRDIGGIVVIDFIDMVLESNRDLVLRRLIECLGRDRTKHQVAEVTSLGLVQMTRKRIGQGLLEVFSEPCEACAGRGVVVHAEPVEARKPADPVAQKRSASVSAGVAKVHAAARRRAAGTEDPEAPDAAEPIELDGTTPQAPELAEPPAPETAADDADIPEPVEVVGESVETAAVTEVVEPPPAAPEDEQPEPADETPTPETQPESEPVSA